MLTAVDVINFCDSFDYDVRKSHNARWIDQKCTADVVSIVADCVYHYVGESKDEFTIKEVWHSEYAVKTVGEIFGKPDLNDEKTIHEYDKFFGQPMLMLAYAGILSVAKHGKKNTNYFTIKNASFLYEIAVSERNARIFLEKYIERVLEDSGLAYLFDDFFRLQNKTSFYAMKNGFEDFLHRNTPIKGHKECGRIFTKVVNTLAYSKRLKGTVKGHISKHQITYEEMIYNRLNFRDVYSDKPKNQTRKEYERRALKKANAKYMHYLSEKAKEYVKKYNEVYRGGRSEYLVDDYNEHALHMHHIFPISFYPEICDLNENIIALTPNQHLIHAHPQGNTKEVSLEYQQQLLLAKSGLIRDSLLNQDITSIYSFDGLKHVLVVGFEDKTIDNIEYMDFDAIFFSINEHYSRV